MTVTNPPSFLVIGTGALAVRVAERCEAEGATLTALAGRVRPAGFDFATVKPRSIEAGTLVVEDGEGQVADRLGAIVEVACALEPGVPLLVSMRDELVSSFAAKLPRPQDVVGVHQSVSATSSDYVEAIRGPFTDSDLAVRVEEGLSAIGLHPVWSPDRPGFLLDTLVMPYLNQALQAFDEGLATASDIDLAVELGLGYPTGPMALVARIGHTTYETRTRSVFDATGDVRFFPPPVLSWLEASDSQNKETTTNE